MPRRRSATIAEIPMRVGAVNKLPEELLGIIIAYAMKYTGPHPWAPMNSIRHPHFQLRFANETKRSIMLVSRRWNDIAKWHMYREIYILASPAFAGLGNIAGYLKELANTSDIHPQLFANRTHSIELHTSSSSPAHVTQMAGVYLCRILSRVTLNRFATTLHVGCVPWLPVLAHRSAMTLTHLSLEFNPRRFPSDAIEQLNSCDQLIFLRLSDAQHDVVHDGHYPESPGDLPQLDLPNLQELEVVSKADLNSLHPIGPIPFHIVNSANLPALRRLGVYEETYTGHANTGIITLTDMVEEHGSDLEHLYARLAYFEDDLETLLDSMPKLTDLTCQAMLPRDPPDNDSVLAHPTLRRLTLSSAAGSFRETLNRIDPAQFPALEYVKITGLSWSSAELGQYGNEVVWTIAEEVEAAIKFAAEGIPLLDENGRPFGGLIGIRQQRGPLSAD